MKKIRMIVLIALVFVMTGCGGSGGAKIATSPTSPTYGSSIEIQKVSVSAIRDDNNLIVVTASGWIAYTGAQKVNEVEYGLLVNKCGTSGEKVWVDIKYRQVIDGVAAYLKPVSYTFPECASMPSSHIFEVEFRVLIEGHSRGPTVTKYAVVPKYN